MDFIPTLIPDVVLIKPKIYEDPRGYFMETYREDKFSAGGISQRFVQENQSLSQQGVLRGLHYQIQHAQGKLVRVIIGEIYDVAVDIRRNSPTFGKWVSCVLSSDNRYQLWIPAGFAHGFYVMSNSAEVVYNVTDYHAPQWERRILWNDPQLGIVWPLLDNAMPILSQKDSTGTLLSDTEVFE